MSSEGDAVAAVEQVEVPSTSVAGPMTVEAALQQVLKKSLAHDGLVRGLRESVKALDRREAELCVLCETTEDAEIIKLVEALCAEHKIYLIKVSDNKKLGEWAGLCKVDREGNARKVVGASVVVVKNWGEESEGPKADKSVDLSDHMPIIAKWNFSDLEAPKKKKIIDIKKVSLSAEKFVSSNRFAILANEKLDLDQLCTGLVENIWDESENLKAIKSPEDKLETILTNPTLIKIRRRRKKFKKLSQ
ncbi:40S ribosomal protein S12, partial [Smittium mucronatum]